MKSQRIVAYGAPLESADLPTPEPRGTEVMVLVSACGVCHSDLHYRDGGYHLGGERMFTLKERGVELPITPGHEPIGRVAALGPEARGVSVGETRLVYPWIGCGSCPRCVAGRDIDCLSMRTLGLFRPGGYSTHLLVPHPRYLLETDGLDDGYASTLACAGLTAWSALKKISIHYSDDGILLIGAGGVGLTAVGFARALWDCPIVVVDRDETKLEAATAMGATHVVRAGPGAVEAVRESLQGPAAAVVDFVGTPDTAQLGFDVLRKGGSLVLIGLHGGAWPLTVAMLPLRNVALVGSLTGTVAETREVIDFVRSRRPDRIPIVARPLREANAALAELADGATIGRQVLVPDADSTRSTARSPSEALDMIPPA
jgi:alcohol dehydrogenase/propanol-preferring alcohol dehydrogenase